jgi:hypothetical protein
MAVAGSPISLRKEYVVIPLARWEEARPKAQNRDGAIVEREKPTRPGV